MKNRSPAVASFVAAGMICIGFLCLMLENNGNYANAENNSTDGVISTFAESLEPPKPLAKIEFDDSIWGDFARAIQKRLSRWLG